MDVDMPALIKVEATCKHTVQAQHMHTVHTPTHAHRANGTARHHQGIVELRPQGESIL